MTQMEKHGWPFNSRGIGYTEDGFPMGDRDGGSEDLAAYFASYIGDGVVVFRGLDAEEDSLKCEIVPGSMMVRVNIGRISIQGRMRRLAEPSMLEFPREAEAKEYRIILRLNLDDAARNIDLMYTDGPLLRTSHVYDMQLAVLRTAAGAYTLDGAVLIDTRADVWACGISWALGMEQAAETVAADLLRVSQAGLWVLQQSYTAAGAVSWTAPDLLGDGRSYVVGVCMIGGGGGGGGHYDPVPGPGGGGGASGRCTNFLVTVTPGVTYTGVVGAGGNAGAVKANGASGGTTSFMSQTALGGGGGSGAVSVNLPGAGGNNGSGGGAGGAGSPSHTAQTTSPGGRGGQMGSPGGNSTEAMGGIDYGHVIIDMFNPVRRFGEGGDGGGGASPTKGMAAGRSISTPGSGGRGGASVASGAVVSPADPGRPGAIYIYVRRGLA